MFGTGVGSSISLVKSSSCSSSGCPRFLLCKYTQKTVILQDKLTKGWPKITTFCVLKCYCLPLLSFLPTFRGGRGRASSLFDGGRLGVLSLKKVNENRLNWNQNWKPHIWKRCGCGPKTHLLISEVNALAKADRNTPLIYAIVFLVHPLIEDICVQNPASMDLKHESHHQNESVFGGILVILMKLCIQIIINCIRSSSVSRV